jgi:serine/threonine protein kinase
VNIFHRDIKPENILICDDGIVRILDLGLSKIISSKERASSTAGTIYYMPKELLIDGPGGGYFSDTYSLGVTMYEMVTGELPYDGNQIGDIVKKICEGKPEPPMSLNSKIDEKLNYIILKAMQCEIEDRYKNIEELLDALKMYQKGDDPEVKLVDSKIEEAMILYNSDKLDDAENELVKLLKTYPDNPRLYLILGEIYNRKHRFNDAIDIYEKGINTHSESGLFLKMIAMSYFAQSEIEKAISYMKEALKKGMDKKGESEAEKLIRLWEKSSM